MKLKSCHSSRDIRAERFFLPGKILALATVAVLQFAGVALAQSLKELIPGHKPRDIPARWKPWIGEYGGAPPSVPLATVHVVSEKEGYIWISERISRSDGVHYESGDKFGVRGSSPEAHGLRIGRSGERELVEGDVVNGKNT